MSIRYTVTFFILLCLVVGCKKKSDQTTVQIDVAKLKELELAERMYEDVKLEEANRLKEAKELKEKIIAEEAHKHAVQLQREMEQKQAEKDKKRQLELEKRAAKRRALDEEIKSLASTESKFGVLAADLRSRQGRLQLKLDYLPSEIKKVELDFDALNTIMSGCMQTVVTNVRKKVGVFEGGEIPEEVITEYKTLSPDEYINLLNNSTEIQGVLKEYDTRMISLALNMVSEDFHYENDRLKREMAAVKSGRGSFRSAQHSAYSHNERLLIRLESQKNALLREVNTKKTRLARVPKGVVNSLKHEIKELENEIYELDLKINIAEGQVKFGRAADIGVTGSFKTQELSIKNEYEANLRGAVNNARQAILIVIDNHRVSLVEELESTQDELSAIQTVLDAYQKGNLSAEQKKAMLNSFERQQSAEVDEATTLLWQ